MWKPMAIAIIFGLLFATVLTLGFVPLLYSLFFRVSFKGFAYDAVGASRWTPMAIESRTVSAGSTDACVAGFVYEVANRLVHEAFGSPREGAPL